MRPYRRAFREERWNMFVNVTQNNVETNLATTMHLATKMRLIALCALVPAFIVVGIIFLFLQDVSIFFSIFLFVLAVVFLVFVLFLYRPVMRKLLTRTLAGKEGQVRYTFREDGYELIVTTATDPQPFQMSGEYGTLLRIVEYDDMWLFYYDKDNIFPISRDGMQEGTAEELGVFFGVKLADRYLVKRKKR